MVIEKILDQLLNSIRQETELYQLGKAEVTSYIIGDIVMERLMELDYIAYIRFASVYRDFSDITDLKQEVDTLIDAGVDVVKTGDQLSFLPNEKQPTTAGGRRKRRR